MTELPGISQMLAMHDLRAAKKFGQNFLFDLNLTDKIVRFSEIEANDLVFEVGPGPGGLTRSLLGSGAIVIAIEADRRFEALLGQLSAYYQGRLSVQFDDALQIDLSTFAEDTPYKIVSNLPYNVGTALLIGWLEANCPLCQSMTLMFQREVAERIVADHGTASYGRLSILTAATSAAQIVMHVPPTAFTPAPKVESAVVHLVPLPAKERFTDLPMLAKITAMAFGQRRKMLRASLKPLARDYDIDLPGWLLNFDIDPASRPETLPPFKFMQLARDISLRSDL